MLRSILQSIEPVLFFYSPLSLEKESRSFRWLIYFYFKAWVLILEQEESVRTSILTKGSFLLFFLSRQLLRRLN